MFQGLKVWLNRISNNMVLLLLNKWFLASVQFLWIELVWKKSSKCC
jgi:hypothetical protein